MVGESADAARALGYHVTAVRMLATAAGGFLAGVGGSFLSLYYPGSWNEGLSSGQGLMAVALVIFARWDPLRCLYASLLFGGAGALGPALQSVGITCGYYLFNAAPYVLTLAIMIATCSRHAARWPATARELIASRADERAAEIATAGTRMTLRDRRPVSLALRRRPAAREHRARSSSTCRPTSAARAATSTRWATTSR